MLRNFTTESTEFTETDGKARRVRIRLRNSFSPASKPAVLSVVKLGIAPAAGQGQAVPLRRERLHLLAFRR